MLKSNHSEVGTEGPLPTGAENLTPVTKKPAPIKKDKTPLRSLLTANNKKQSKALAPERGGNAYRTPNPAK